MDASWKRLESKVLVLGLCWTSREVQGRLGAERTRFEEGDGSVLGPTWKQNILAATSMRGYGSRKAMDLSWDPPGSRTFWLLQAYI